MNIRYMKVLAQCSNNNKPMVVMNRKDSQVMAEIDASEYGYYYELGHVIMDKRQIQLALAKQLVTRVFQTNYLDRSELLDEILAQLPPCDLTDALTRNLLVDKEYVVKHLQIALRLEGKV